MAAPYAKRYPGGFLDLPSQTTAVDSAFLNAVESALLQILGVAPAVDTVGVWAGGANGAMVYQKITNAQIAAGAAIDKSKLAALNITDADIAAAAGIAKSKLGPLNIANADVVAGAAIAISKLAGYPADATKALMGDGTWAKPGSMVLLDDLVVAGAALASYDTNTRLGGNIPSSFKHLRLIVSGRSDAAVTSTSGMVRFNNDATAGNYISDYIASVAGGAPSGNQTTALAGIGLGTFTGASSGAGLAGATTIDIPDYAGTTFNKIVTMQNFERSQGRVDLGGGGWASTSAITRIQLALGSGSWAIGTRFTLYGIT